MRLAAALIAFLALVAVCTAAVVKLTPENFDAVVNDESKHVFVKFFAPWCGHCVRMAPAWEELASSNTNSDVVIAELDAAAHGDVASRQGVRGFPTIKFFSKTNKGGINYQGARDVASFQKFLEANAN
jgi:protein disulfide-isomerase-like protein